MQNMDPRILAAIVAMMQQEQGQQAPSAETMPPAQGTYPDPLGSMSVGAVGGAGMGGAMGGPVGAAVGGAGGGLAGLIAAYLQSRGPAAQATQAYTNEYGPGNQIR